MEWTSTQARRFAQIDRELASLNLAPAEYEVVRRVVAMAGNPLLATELYFSERALSLGAAALAARCPIITDSAMVQAGIEPFLRSTFANPVYCAMNVGSRSLIDPSQIAKAFQQLIHQTPESIIVIGQFPLVLAHVGKAIAQQTVHPALIVATPVSWLEEEQTRQQTLTRLPIPQISIRDRQGGAAIAVAMMDALIDLTWQAYRQTRSNDT
jgi:precorrin-8X/cobalt-precorrin-8 methylmutase